MLTVTGYFTVPFLRASEMEIPWFFPHRGSNKVQSMRARVVALCLAILHRLHCSHTICWGVAVPDGVYKGEGHSGVLMTQPSPMRNKLRMIKPMSTSSVNSFVTTPDSSQRSLSSISVSMSPVAPAPVQDRGVGLSDPDQSAGRRKMLELVNRMHNTGLVFSSEVANTWLTPS